MKTVKLIISFLLVCAFTIKGNAMAGEAHRHTLLQALSMLQTGDEQQKWLYSFYQYHASRSGTSPQATIAEMGPAPDNFLDTVIGGWWIGYRYFIEVQFLTNIGFTSYWHFSSAFRPGKFGDRYNGYSYAIAPEDGFFGLNTMVKNILYNQEIQSGSYENAKGLVLGLKDIFQIITEDWLGLLSDFYNGEKDSGWGIPGASDVIHDYQTQTASTDRNVNGQYAKGTNNWRVPASNWDDIQDTYFNPGANAGQYWYNQFTHNASFDDVSEEQLKQMGYAMHWIADGSSPQHVWSTTDHYHTDFESYMDEFITGSTGFKASRDKVDALITEFEKSAMTTYAQKFNLASDLDSGAAPTGAINNISDDGPAIKDLVVGGKHDATLYSAGDILRWLAEKAVQENKVLSDDSEATFKSTAERTLTLAVAGEILLLRKGVADLYKKREYDRIVSQNPTQLNGDLFGFGTFKVGTANYNSIR